LDEVLWAGEVDGLAFDLGTHGEQGLVISADESGHGAPIRTGVDIINKLHLLWTSHGLYIRETVAEGSIPCLYVNNDELEVIHLLANLAVLFIEALLAAHLPVVAHAKLEFGLLWLRGSLTDADVVQNEWFIAD